MEYNYQPKDPRGKLREIACKWTQSMKVAGRGPNRDVAFIRDGTQEEVCAHGWLVDDRRPGVDGCRYLVMEDGDVWRATGSDPTTALDAALEAWLAEPNDDLVTLLARALSDARYGGSGWLEEGQGVQRVADRRTSPQPYGGPERRH